MKTCNDVTEKILNGFENDPEVMAHLADCPECKELAENAKQIRLKPGMMTPPPALDMAIHNMAVVAAASRKERPLYFRRAIIRVSAAAVLALCACVLGVLHTPAKKVEKGVVAAQKKRRRQRWLIIPIIRWKMKRNCCRFPWRSRGLRNYSLRWRIPAAGFYIE